MRIFKIIKNQLSEHSFPEFIKILIHSIYKNEHLIIYSIDLDGMGQNDCSNDIFVKKGTSADLTKAREQMEPFPWEFQCDLYDGVEDFFIATDNEHIQHINWIYYWNHHNRILSLGEQEVEFKFGLTLPHFRGRGLQPRTLKVMCRYLAEKGFERAFTCVLIDNLSSIRGIEKAGFKRVGEVRLRKLAGLQISRRVETSKL